jgi:hypothetical protein
MFVSFDNGAHWQSFQLNLPNVPITDLKVHRNDLVVSTQGRAFWILDNISSLHQLTPQVTSSTMQLYRPRDGYRTVVAALGPAVDYYLPSAPAGPVVIEILDPTGRLVNSYNSEVPAAGGRGGRGGRGGGESDDPDVAMMFGRTRGNAAGVGRVGKTEGFNRFIWDVRNQAGLAVPPGEYQARLTIGSATLTQSFAVLIDPNVAADGTSVADLKEQFEHNTRTRDLVTAANQAMARVREAQARLKGAAGADAQQAKQIEAIAARLMTEPVRYGKPGLQAHIQYLAGMTSRGDQKVGRDALERYAQLKKDLDALKIDLDRILGPGTGPR